MKTLEEKAEKFNYSDLNERSREILLGIVEGYFGTASPVGSKFIAENSKLNLSSASIRNIMALLEESGYIYQPHFSAGRIPTAKGYKFYIDSLMKTEKISLKEKENIEIRLSSSNRDLNGILNQVSILLSDLSHYAGVVLAPDMSEANLLHIEFIRIKEKNILAIIVFANGVAENKSFYITKDIKQNELTRYSNKLNEIIEKKNCSLDDLKEIITEEMHNDKEIFSSILSKEIFSSIGNVSGYRDYEHYDNCLYVGPEGDLIEEPEFSNNEQIKFLIKTISDKKNIIKLLGHTKNSKTKQIFIGSEEEWSEISGLSLITAPYISETNMLRGSIGIIGPLRMNYSHVIPIIDFVSEFLSGII
ncbi:MAG: heat-inducible transcriptional repressor HrcA [Candidatus Acidulodesulfobacterium sp.]